MRWSFIDTTSIVQVLSHLPMGHAVPLQLSSLLQPVNKLRFYFVSGKYLIFR